MIEDNHIYFGLQSFREFNLGFLFRWFALKDVHRKNDTKQNGN